jgi:hypothetical protein
MNKWQVINWETGEVYWFHANNPRRFIKKHLKTYKNALRCITIERIKEEA